MNGISWFYAIFFYAALAVFTVGFLLKIWKYARTPAPLRISLTPAPTTSGGVVLRMVQEVGLFKSLFKSNRIIWLGGYIFHLALAIALIKHIRLFYMNTPGFLNYIATYEMYVGYAMLGALGLLLLLRLVIDRHAYISVMTDYLLLLLLMAIALTGVIMKYFIRVDIANIKVFSIGIISMNPQPLPTGEPILLVHLTLVLLLLMYFPFSKLMHAGGVFFSPTRNQIDNPRNTRHVNPWAGEPETTGGGGGAVETTMKESPEPTG